jgi:hypothetical protein
MRSIVAAAICALSLVAGCAHKDLIPGTNVVENEVNREVIKTVEQYRQWLEERNVEGLLLLASERYFEDAGTPRADDDYNYNGLKQVLTSRLSRIRSIRYEIQYRNVKVSDNQAEVEVFLNGAFELLSEAGERYRRINDFHRFVLERTPQDRWKFLSGM